jgi:tetratricopeptide (TPR) repeat protein
MKALWSELRGFYCYSAAVFSISFPAKTVSYLGLLVLAGCAAVGGENQEAPTPIEFYTVTAEIALLRGEPRVAALQYAAAAARDPNPGLLQRATEVGADTLQPSLTAKVAQRWIGVEPKSVDAQRAAARAALQLYRIDDAAAHYRAVVTNTPSGVEAAFADVEGDLTGDDNIFGARVLADRLAAAFPDSAAARRMQGLTSLRADDPAAAVQALTHALSSAEAPPAAGPSAGRTSDTAAADARRELAQTLLRARIMAGDVEEPLAQARAQISSDDSAGNRLQYAVLLMTAQRDAAAAEQLQILAANPASKPAALRLLGLLQFQQGQFEAADETFKQVLRTAQFLDDAFYYLAIIADRNGDSERALRLYSQVQHGDNVLPALLRAAAILYRHGAPAAADELLDRLGEDEPQRAPEIINTRARIYADSGELPKAYDVLQKGLDEYPDSVELRYARASVFEDEGKIKEALRELELVLKARPEDPAAMNAYGFTLADHSKSLAKARRLIERAHDAAPKNAAILDSLGWVLFRQGHDVEALPYLRAAYTDDRGGDIAAHLGEVLWQQGKHDEAQRLWNEASLIDADNKLLKSTRQRLQDEH